MRRNEQRSFVIRITAADQNRGTRSTRLIGVEKAGANVRQNFLPIEAHRDLPIFDDHLSGPGELRVRCEQYSDRTLLGAYYQQEFGLPAPVFAEQGPVTVDTSPDSTFTVQVALLETGQGNITWQGLPMQTIAAVDLPKRYNFNPAPQA